MNTNNILNIYIFGTVSFLLFNKAISNENYTEEKKAVKWLLGERQSNWGWGGIPTAYALIALQVIDFGDRLDRQLSAKQLEIDLVLQLWKHHEKPALTSAQIALYALALTSSCQDPRQFHGIDLIGHLEDYINQGLVKSSGKHHNLKLKGSLLHHSEPDSDSEFALCSLAMCSAGTHVRKRHLRRLLNIANTKHNIESLSGVILALKCIVRDHRNRNMQHYLKKPVLALARSQLADGSFGSLLATSLAVQALGEDTASWNKTEAISWIKSHQNSDGSFNDIRTTANVIMVLNDKGMASVKEIDCDEREALEEEEAEGAIIPHLVPSPKNKTDINSKWNKSKTSNKTDGFDETSGSDGTNTHEDSTVTYTLWVGSNVTENRTTTLTVTHNATFYNVMQIAAEQDNKYAFAATEWPNGHYVHTLAGFKEQPMSYHYWLLYRLPNLPDPNNPPGNQFVAPTGVDDLIVKDGEHYLFWYKKL